MKKFWKATGIGAAYFIVFMVVQFLVSLAGILILLGSLILEQGMGMFKNPEQFREIYMTSLLTNMTWLVLVSNLVSILGLWIFFATRHKNFLKEVGLQKTSARNLTMSVIFGTGVCFFVDLLTNILPFPETVIEQFELQHGMLWFGDIGLTFLSVALIGPVSEEICFRGLCYRRLKEGMPKWAAGLISSVFFGLAHGDPVWFLVGFVAGVSLSWIFETTGSLLPAIIVHVTNNAISALTSYFPLPEGIHQVLMYSGLLIAAGSAYLLHSWTHRPVEKQGIQAT